MNISDIFKKNRNLLVISVICSIIIQFCVVYGTGLITAQMDVLIDNGNVDIGRLLLYVIPATAVAAVLSLSGGKCVGIYSAKIVKETQSGIVDRLLKAKNSVFMEESKGSLISKMISDIGELEKYTSSTIPEFCTAIVSILVVAIYVGYCNIFMLIIPAVIYPFIIACMDYLGNILKGLAQKRRGNIDELVSRVSDGVDGIEVIKTYNLYENTVQKIQDSIDVILENEYKRAWITHFSQTVSRFLFCIPNMLCPAFAFFMAINGKITVGEMTTYIVLINKIIQSMKRLPFYIGDIKEKKVSVKRLEQVISAEVVGEIKYTDSGNSGMEIVNLGFGYALDKKVLNNINLKIDPDSTVAIVGMSGQGKSTLFKILAGLEDEFDGKCSIAKKRAIVPQKPLLFEGTIAENIAVGSDGATREEIIEAAKLAGIHEKIAGLEDGYDTVIGENGAGLSGGEKQRICVARAMISQADVLLLDEPTSAVDENTEKIIMNMLTMLKGKKTIIIISHRLQFINNADVIYVVDKGNIAERGNHTELVEKNGIYKQLWDMEVCNEA